MGTQQLSGQGLSALASLSWKSPAPVSRWLGAQRPLGSLSPTLSHWLSAAAPGIRRSDHREARAAFAAVSPHPRRPAEHSLPESSCLGSGSRVSLLARSARPARSSRASPPHGQVPYWVRSRLAGLLSRESCESLPGRCLRGVDRVHWSPSGRWSASGCGAASACAPRGAAARGPRRELRRAVQPAPARCRGS